MKSLDKFYVQVCLAALGLPLLSAAGCFGDDPFDMRLIAPKESDTDTGSAEADGGIVAPNGCNPEREPTWENPIDEMMQAQCYRCHKEETADYESIQVWVDNGFLETYCLMGAGHFLTSGQEYCLRWLEIGAPKTDCDVSTK